MGKYQKPVERESDDKPKAPEMCGNADCRSVWSPKFQDYLRGYADITIHLDGYTIYRCQHCYLKQLEQAGRSTMATISKGRMYFTMDDVRDHWDALDAKGVK